MASKIINQIKPYIYINKYYINSIFHNSEKQLILFNISKNNIFVTINNIFTIFTILGKKCILVSNIKFIKVSKAYYQIIGFFLIVFYIYQCQ